MSTLNIILFILIIVALLYSAVVSLLGIRREMLLHKRRNICYENYYDYKPLFNKTINLPYLIVAGIACLMSLTLIVTVSFNVQLRVYIFALVAALALVGIMIYLHTSSIKYNRDLDEFDEFHTIIESSYANKEKIEGNIKLINEKYEVVARSIGTLNLKLSELIKDFKDIPDLDDCLEPLIKLRKEQETILASFNTNLSDVFDKSINDYLINNGTVKASNYIFNPDKEMKLDKIMNDISLAVKEKFKLYVIDSFKNMKHKNASALIELANLLYQYDAFENEFSMVLLKATINNPEEYSIVVDYMYSKKLIHFDILEYCVNNKYDWIFTKATSSSITTNEFTKLIVDIIKLNYLKLTNKFLILCEKSDAEYIKNALSVAAVSNETSILMENYIELLQVDGGFNSLATRYENIALALDYYYNVIGTGNTKIKDIIAKDSFLAFKDYLDSTYNTVMISLEPLIMKSFRTMLYYSMYCKDKVSLFDMNKIYYIYSEYKRTLNVNGLLCLVSLMDSMMCIYVNDSASLDAIKANINESAGLKAYDSYYPLSSNKDKDPKKYGKDLINNLLKNKKTELTTIINHIEKERLCLDKIRYI